MQLFSKIPYAPLVLGLNPLDILTKKHAELNPTSYKYQLKGSYTSAWKAFLTTKRAGDPIIVHPIIKVSGFVNT